MRKGLLVVAAAAVLVFAGVGGAVANSIFRAKVGDSVFLKGSSVVCVVGTDPRTGNEISCYKRRGKKTVVGTYSVFMSDKYAVILKVTNTHGNGKTVVAKRQP